MIETNILLSKKNFDLVNEISNFDFNNFDKDFPWDLLNFLDISGGGLVKSNLDIVRSPRCQLKELVCDVMVVEQQRVYLDLLSHKLFSSLADHLNSVDLLSKDNLLKFRGKKYLNNHLNSLVNSGSKFSYLMLDLDLFSDVNNTYGHLVGDSVLSDLGDLIRDELRQSDVPYLYGGDEIGIVLPETCLMDAKFVAEKLRKSIDDYLVVGFENLVSKNSSYNLNSFNPFICVNYNITSSIGVSEFSEFDSSSLDVVRRADEALYLSKNSGRNKVTLK
jgi:diguanylate cyclase (GGDEF)-like protein